nr:DUF3748 domain-containing protein [Terrimicrobiaceae bacterium]
MTIFFLGQLAAIVLAAPAETRQITHAEHGHMLTNCGVWSPDGEWIVYDTRKSGDQFDGTRIEQVSTRTGQVRTIFSSRDGAACGVATHHPYRPEIVFIGGPEHPSSDWNYGFTRRRGILVNTETGAARPLDAMTYAPPFVPGALRGGSHVHVFSGDGQRVSFTYEDEVLRCLDGTESPHEPNQRNVGVALADRRVRVHQTHPRNHDGEFFSFLATRTTAEPAFGSDEISRACEEAWVGKDGYLRPDGTRQRHALAFQGTVR